MHVSKLTALPFVPNHYRVSVVLSSLREKLRGLDFSMPDRMYDRNRNDGAMYVASPDEILLDLLSCVDIAKFHGFFDVGCGKGYVLWKAGQWGFDRVGGVEYDWKLYKTCEANLEKLGVRKAVDITCGDACEYEHYGDYDVFYFFNPFMDDVMRRVMEKILDQCAGKEIMILYYRPRYTDAIESSGCLKRIAERYDPAKGYNAYVYRGRIPEKRG